MAGFGAPLSGRSALIVIETADALTGCSRRVPLVATMGDGCAFVSTLRGARSRLGSGSLRPTHIRYRVAGREHRDWRSPFALAMAPPAQAACPRSRGAPPATLLAPATLFE